MSLAALVYNYISVKIHAFMDAGISNEVSMLFQKQKNKTNRHVTLVFYLVTFLREFLPGHGGVHEGSVLYLIADLFILVERECST